MNRKVHVRCGAGEKLEIISKAYLSLYDNDYIENYGSLSLIDDGTGNDTIKNGAHKVTTGGGDDDDEYEGDAGLYIVDEEWLGGGDSVTISGGDGNDYIYNDAGEDYNQANKIKIYGGKGNDKIYNNGDNVTIDGGADNDYIDNSGDRVKINGGAGNDTILVGGENNTVNGGSGNDSLICGKSKDTLNGGAGNDLLWGGAGNDVFIYKPNEGTDRIMDYESGDMLQILKADGNKGGSFDKATFKNDTLTLNITGGGKVIFNGVGEGDKFNINGTTYKISGSKLK